MTCRFAIFLCEIRRKSDHVLRAEPVGIEIGKTERFIQCDRRRVSLNNLKIRFRCTEPDSLGEDCAADRGSVVAVAVRRMHMDGIDTDVIAVADAKAGGNDRSGFILDGGTDGFFLEWRGTSKERPCGASRSSCSLKQRGCQSISAG